MHEHPGQALRNQAQDDLIEHKRAEYEHVRRNTFALVECEWTVRRDADGDVTLTLAKFEPPVETYEYETPNYSLDVPSGLGITASFPPEGLTQRGERNLRHGETIKLGIFGTTQQFDKATGTLHLAPIVVFSRAEAGRRGII